MRSLGANLVASAVCLVVIALAAVYGERPAPVREQPVIVPVPASPSTPPDGKRKRRPHQDDVVDGVAVMESTAPDGTQPYVDYPQELWFRNIGSHRDGAGMCVFTAFEFTCLWVGLDQFRGFRDWCAERYPGGGYPSKLASLVKAYCKAKDISNFDPDKQLIQYEGSEPAWIEQCLKNGWMPGVTLYHSPRYGGGTIYHMTNCPHLDGKWGCTQDNNFKDYEWASRDEWLRRIKLQGRYWAFAVLVPGPPPCPKN